MAWTQERIARTALAHFEGFGSHRLRALFKAFPSASDAWLASYSSLLHSAIPPTVAEAFVAWRKNVDPHKLIEQLEREQIRVVLPTDDEYPLLLAESSDPPEVLFVRGSIPTEPAIAIVGTRHITSYGRRCLEGIVPELVQTGLAVVSGLAMGIDGEAHTLALKHAGKTFAFLGSGVNNQGIYPRYNLKLAQDMLENGGGLASEFPPGSISYKGNFPVRNRLIASFALATVVVEAADNSGSLITAKLALEENREVMAVPGGIWSETSRGTNRLIKAGAKVCTSAQDILEVLSIDQPELVAQTRALLPLDAKEQKILEALAEPKHVDQLQRELGLNSHQMSSALSLLEMKGLIQPIGGQMWLRTAYSAPV